MHIEPTKIMFKDEARALYLDADGNVDFDAVADRYAYLKTKKESLGNKFFNDDMRAWAKSLSQEKQQHLLDIMLGGLSNEDASVGVYAMHPQDYENFATYLEPIIRSYHGIEGDTVQLHDWDIPVGEYLLDNIDPSLTEVSMRARVARNVADWNLPSSMDKEERVAFEVYIAKIFAELPFVGEYFSLTPGHAAELSEAKAEEMRKAHYLFNDMTSDNHLTSSGIASDWPEGRGIWLSADNTKMIWVGEEDHLRIITIIHGSDLGLADASLGALLSALEASGVNFARHDTYGYVTTCPTNMGTGKRQSVLLQFPNLSERGTNEARLKQTAKSYALQARGLAGEHSSMDERGTADISPLARFGVTEAEIARKLHDALVQLYQAERTA